MKRRLFLSGSAAALASCAGHHVVPSVPSTTGAATSHAPLASLKLIPATPDPISAKVLANPIVGEAFRFSGASAPKGWLFMQGQSLRIDQYPALFSVIGRAASSKNSTTFTLSNLGYGVVIAATGTIPASPQAHAQMRDLSHQTSLGPGALPPPPKPFKSPSPAETEARRLIASAVRPRNSSPVAVSDDATVAMDHARSNANRDAVGTIAPRTAAVVRDAVDAAVAGRTTVYGAVTQVAREISVAEATSVLAVNDRMQRTFSQTAASSHPDPQREAAHFLVTSAITPEQADAIAERE